MRISHPFSSLVLLTIASAALAASAKDFRVSSAAELAGITKEIRPGDTVILKDGDWTGQALVFTGQGTVEKPVAFRAESPGKVRLTGKSSLIINGQNVIVSGLLFEGGQGPGDAIKLLGQRCRLTETAMVGGSVTNAFFMLLGELMEHSRTEDLFLNPQNSRTAEYIEGRDG